MARFGVVSSLLLWCLQAGAALSADWEGIYQGTLGRAKIIVQLVEQLDDMEGITRREYSRYSYLPTSRDLNLFMTGDGTRLSFDESPQQPWEFMAPDIAERMITGRWMLSAANGIATGTWASADGKTELPIVLRVVPELAQDDVTLDRNAMNETYNHLWLETLTYADAGRAKTFGPVDVRFVRDSAFGIEFPVIGRFPDARQKDRINALLMKAHRATLADYRDCKSSVPIAWVGETEGAELAYEVHHASEALLSFTESGSLDCGGAHPGNSVSPKTFDLTTPVQMGGQYNLDLSPDGFGRVLKLATTGERIAFEHFALGRWKDAEAKDTDMAGACKTGFIDDAPEGAKMFSLSFMPRGLAVLRTDFPHAVSVCLSTAFNPTIIAWSDLTPWLKPGQTLLTTEVSP